MARTVAALLMAAALWAAAAHAQPADFNGDGACSYKSLLSTTVKLPSSTGCRGACRLRVTATGPNPSGAGAAGCPQGPYPVVYFFNGFQARAALYSYLARRLASWGFVVVQYDDVALLPPSDEVELAYLDAVKAAVAGDAGAAKLVDLTRQAVGGHSRGGKLAALHMAAAPSTYKTAVLVDPIDNTAFSPESAAYPSAAKALAALRPPKQAAVLGATVVSACNPAASNYALFYSSLAPGSWRAVLPGTTHTDFLSPAIIRGVCGRGTASAAAKQGATMAAATAWLQSAFYNANTTAFTAWAAQNNGTVQLTVKA